jgi:hypothetical protein
MKTKPVNIFGRLGERSYLIQVPFFFIVAGLIWVQELWRGEGR